MASNILIQLRSGLEFLTSAERKIADVILSDPQRFITCSLNDLSALAGVSHGSIINFSKKYGGSGFPALKLSVAAGLHTGDTRLSAAVPGDSFKEVLAKNIASQTRSFENTSDLNHESVFESAAGHILKAKKVEIYGIYRSAVIATDLYYQMQLLGISVSFVSDILTCALSASMLDKDDLVIAVSSSGRTGEIINAVKNAKARGVHVVSLTSGINSPLARLSDEVLLVAANDTSLSGRISEIRLSQMLLADTLCAYLLNKMDDARKNRYLELTAVMKTYSVDD